MQQTTPAEPTTVQTGQTTVQSGDTTVQTGGTTVETGGTTVQAAEPTTLHDFTLGLLTDLDAREAFQQDPLGCLEAAGLSDITAGDVHDILPLVLDAASVPNVEGIEDILGGTELPAVDSLLQIAGTVEGVTGVTDIAAPSAITALVSDFSGLGDVSGTLDSVVSTVPQATDVVSNVSDIATHNVTKVTDVVDVHGIHNTADVLVKDLDADVLVKDVADTDVLVKNVLNSADVVDVNNVADVAHVTDNALHVTDNVVQNVAQVGDVHHDLGQVIGDVKVGDLDLLDGGIGNHNNVDVHF
ncbi:IniB N-terminal domain-containing protein [Lentzea flava]|uniref:Uncharacterized protein n=1 Tax=Lentzea flava TaxID=103732 RepID=A0ABQ2UWC6_9PSEU|nr:IniB N-terminal domain-containing protein [Lentzea flava]MCP2202136.1 hypothetical protein [Lentzea flava]GGU57246.1 hypothetical protein GCM10010178_57090 [Lentzea flava]